MKLAVGDFVALRLSRGLRFLNIVTLFDKKEVVRVSPSGRNVWLAEEDRPRRATNCARWCDTHDRANAFAARVMAAALKADRVDALAHRVSELTHSSELVGARRLLARLDAASADLRAELDSVKETIE
jgi:hypothetical protein